METAEFSQSRNDLYWKKFFLDDGYIRWTGYDDDYWWSNISTTDRWRTRVGKSGRTYTLNPETDQISIVEPVND